MVLRRAFFFVRNVFAFDGFTPLVWTASRFSHTSYTASFVSPSCPLFFLSSAARTLSSDCSVIAELSYLFLPSCDWRPSEGYYFEPLFVV